MNVYEYRRYIISITSDGAKITDPSGTYVGQCESDREAEDFVDRLITEMSVPTVKEHPEIFYLYRLPKMDRDITDNYQYFDGKRFRYGASNIKYLPQERCEKLLDYYKQYSDYFVYRMAKGTQ